VNIKQFLTLGLLCFTSATEMVAMEEAQSIQSQVYQVEAYPVRESSSLVGTSHCAVREVVLQPGLQQGSWNHRFVDGNDGRYSWRHIDSGERLFAFGDGGRENIQEFQNEQGEHRYGRDELPRMEPLHNPISLCFGLDHEIPIRQLQVCKGRGHACAYNAYKNCRLIVQELTHPRGNLQKQLESSDVVYELLGAQGELGELGRWRGHILNNHLEMCAIKDGIHAGGRLHPEGLHELINLEQENHRVTVIPAGRFQEHFAQDPLEIRCEYTLPKNPDEDIAHGFMFQDCDHWLTAVLRRSHGRIDWLIADSNNNPAFNRLGLMHLLASLQGKKI
jgi:hypothetical protein